MPKSKVEITAETITTIINDKRPTSLTDISRALGHKGTISGSVAARIRELVPNVADLLAANKPAKDAKDAKSASDAKPEGNPKINKKAAKASAKPATGKKTAGAVAYPLSDCIPYRESSGYAQVWAILHAHKDTGISKTDLTAKYQAWCKKPLKNCQFDVHVVISPKEDGSCHRSAAKAAQSYWIQRENDFLRLRMIGEGKK
jgi:hypothetical protein